MVQNQLGRSRPLVIDDLFGYLLGNSISTTALGGITYSYI